MLFEMLEDYVEAGRIRKALKGCIELAEVQVYISEESYQKLYETIEKYIPEDKH